MVRALIAVLCVVLWTERLPIGDGWHWEARLRWCQEERSVRIMLEDRMWRRTLVHGDAGPEYRYDREDGEPPLPEPAEHWWRLHRTVVITAF